jgi:hypothetical protein
MRTFPGLLGIEVDILNPHKQARKSQNRCSGEPEYPAKNRLFTVIDGFLGVAGRVSTPFRVSIVYNAF